MKQDDDGRLAQIKADLRVYSNTVRPGDAAWLMGEVERVASERDRLRELLIELEQDMDADGGALLLRRRRITEATAKGSTVWVATSQAQERTAA